MDSINKELLRMGSEYLELDKELTKKFLSGEMSFADYSNEWYMNEDEENIDELMRRHDDEPAPSTSVDKGVPKRHRRVTRLTPALMGLMGEANLRFARGDIETAEKMCHEIIKQVPTASEPYQTLAQIYENDSTKHLQFSLLAAHLRPSDANEWLRLAALCKQSDEIKQEMICYNRAVRAQPQNLDIHLKRLEALSLLDKDTYVGITPVKCYHRIVQSLPSSEGQIIMKYAKMAAAIYHKSEEFEDAFQVMAIAYNKCHNLFTHEDLNMFFELLINQKQFQTCIEVFVSNCEVEIEAEILTVKNDKEEIEEQTHYTKCSIPNNLPIDLKSKLLICFIHLGSMNLVKTLLDDFIKNDVEKTGDLYMDIEEVLSSHGHYDLALYLLEPLTKNEKFDLGAVWLKHANCLCSLGRETEAIASYYKVLAHAPQHPEARKRIFAILERTGQINAALEVLNQNPKYVVSAGLLYEQCFTLKKYNQIEKYLDVGEAFLSKTFAKYRHVEELNLAFRAKGGTELIQSFRTLRGENPYNEDDIHFDEDEDFKLSPEEEWNFFTDVLFTACEHKNYILMQKLAFGAISSKNITSYRSEIEFFCLQSSLLNNDYVKAFKFIKEFTIKMTTTRCWNLMNFVMNSLEENTHCKFLSRLFQRENYFVKHLFLGNNFLNSGRYLVALKYFLEYHNQFKEPVTALLIAITILTMASQRTVDKHHNLVLQGMAYLLTYKNLRKCDQETYYNMGRAYQMLSINNLAIEYYERALKSPDIAVCENHGIISLKKETAYNLYVLYKDHAPQIARRYMLKYIVIE